MRSPIVANTYDYDSAMIEIRVDLLLERSITEIDQLRIVTIWTEEQKKLITQKTSSKKIR